ncbi:MAG: hypothetical protein OES32_08925 [Acidobacteriota bacterium]|nr:hypothetical protein [Acidobacteriota bacterium]
MVEGSLVGLFDDGETDFSESDVWVDSVVGIGALVPPPTSPVSATSTFHIEGVPVGLARVTVTGYRHVTRRMMWEIREGTTTFAGIDLLNDLDFARPGRHRAAWIFGSMFRPEGGLRRWVAPAQIVVVSPNIDPALVLTVVGELATITRGGFFASVEVRPPTAAEQEALAAGCEYSGTAALGKIFVGQGQGDESYYCLVGGEVGLFPGPENEVAWGRARVQNDLDSIRHGLGHAAGALHPCTGAEDLDTVMGGSCGYYGNQPARGGWTPIDLRVFLAAYSRPPGTRPPDDTRHLAPMTGTVSDPGGANAPAGPTGPIPEPGSTDPLDAHPQRPTGDARAARENPHERPPRD